MELVIAPLLKRTMGGHDRNAIAHVNARSIWGRWAFEPCISRATRQRPHHRLGREERQVLIGELRTGSRGEKFGAGVQKAFRIDRFAINAHFIVQMRPGGAAGGANTAQNRAQADVLAGENLNA